MSDADQPNVLVILTDQQRWDTVGTLGSPMNLTPNLDATAAEGTLLERTFTPQPVCAPARGCLQTGQFATEHGVYTNRSIPLEPTEPRLTLANQFARNGYDTGYVGKWHLGDSWTDPVPEGRRLGYDYWRAADLLEFTSHPYEGILYDEDGGRVEYDGYRVDALTELALEFVREDRENPFLCFLSYLEPHHQNDMEAYVAPDGYAERYKNPYVPPDLRDTPGDWYEELPDYYGICRRIDECYGRILNTLEEEGILDKTIVVFTSDHGSHFRTRNDEYKRSCHEASVRVPAVIRGPGFEGGGTISELVSLLDVPVTLLDAAGITPPDTMRGRSIRRLLEEDNPEWRDEVFIQISETEVGRAIRTDRWKYSVYAPEKDGNEDPASEEYVDRYLYDLAADPYEQENLIGHVGYRKIAAELRERLEGRINEVEDEATISSTEYYA